MDIELEKILDVLAERFGTTVEYLYAVMIRQAYVTAVSQLLVILGLCLLSFVYLKVWQPKLVAHYKKGDGDPDYELPAAFGMGLGWFFIIGTVIQAFSSFEGIVTRLVNPEYWVLQQILGMFGG